MNAMHANEARLARDMYNRGFPFPNKYLLEYVFTNIRESSERGSSIVCMPLPDKWASEKCKKGLELYMNGLEYTIVFSENDGYHSIRIEW